MAWEGILEGVFVLAERCELIVEKQLSDRMAALQGKMHRPGEDGGARGLVLAGSYRRKLTGSVERLLENALDWEHLPWLHRSSFAWIKREASGNWGWRARLGLPKTEEEHEIHLELLLDHDARTWVSRVLAGEGEGNEIWSRTEPIDSHHCEVFVEFHLANIREGQAESYGKAYERLYARLYDEDETMMTIRQEQLEKPRATEVVADELVLGRAEEIDERLPIVFEYGAETYRLVKWKGEYVVHSTVCPHFLGPLDACDIDADGTVECPWHGCRFDVMTGKSVDANAFRLTPPPRVEVRGATGEVVVRGR